jgi:hypothetical protein
VSVFVHVDFTVTFFDTITFMRTSPLDLFEQPALTASCQLKNIFNPFCFCGIEKKKRDIPLNIRK